MIYIIEVPERHTAYYTVRADSEDEAREAAGRGNYISVEGLEFVETIGAPSEWEVMKMESE